MTVLTSPKTYAVLAAFQAIPAAVWASGLPFAARLEHLGYPPNTRRLLEAVKTAATIGLFSVNRFPGLAELTTAMLTL